MEDKDNLPLIIGALAGLLFASFMLTKRYQVETVHPPEQTAVAVTPEGVASKPNEPQTPLPLYAIQKQPGTRTVYECVQNRQRTFSDSPCGEGAKARTISPTNVMDAHQPIYRSDPSFDAPTRRGTEQDDTVTRRRDCAEYENDVKRIDARMRMGYTSSEGEFWRQQRRNAAAARDDCKRDNRLR